MSCRFEKTALNYDRRPVNMDGIMSFYVDSTL